MSDLLLASRRIAWEQNIPIEQAERVAAAVARFEAKKEERLRGSASND